MFLPFLMNNSYCWILFCHHLEIYLFRKLLGRWKVLLAARELEQRVSREEWASDRYRDLSIFPLMWIEINIKNITKVQITWEIYYWPPKLAHYRFYKIAPARDKVSYWADITTYTTTDHLNFWLRKCHQMSTGLLMESTILSSKLLMESTILSSELLMESTAALNIGFHQ